MPSHSFRRFAAPVLLGALLLPVSGCQQHTQVETPVVRYTGDERFPMSKAIADGEYVLYDKDEKKAIKSFTLVVGDALGFRKEGKYVIAVAGNNELKLPAGAYVWKRS